jgi:non-heme Fe2+,alpha-ketoglutarate-dependent halogenase
MKSLSDAAVRQYHELGYYAPVPVMTRAEAGALRRKLEAFEGSGGSMQGPVRHKPHLLFTWLNDLIRHPRILDAVEDVIGPDILVWTSTFFIKEPRSETFAAWHQDGAYFGLEPREQVCAWVALTDASREAGCMEMVSSHGTPRQLHHSPMGLRHSINRAGQTIVEPFDERSPVAMALAAGQFSLHHELAIHRSAPNNASHRRVGIGINYLPTRVRVNGPVRLKAMLVRGEDRYGYWDLIDPPSAERDTAALAVHQQVSERYRENYKVQVERHERMFGTVSG